MLWSRTAVYRGRSPTALDLRGRQPTGSRLAGGVTGMVGLPDAGSQSFPTVLLARPKAKGVRTRKARRLLQSDSDRPEASEYLTDSKTACG